MLRLFGTLRADVDDLVLDLGPPKQRAVLAILALSSGHAVSTDSLIDAVWGETPPRTAAHSVQIYVSELRKALAPAPAFRIQTARPGYVFEAPSGSVDIIEFERLVVLGTAARDVTALEAAMSLWVADPLHEFRYDDWAHAHIERLAERRAEAAVGLSEAMLDRDPQLALRWAEIALAAAPYGERGCELAMLSQYRLGHHAESLRTYEEFRRRLDDDRGLVPTPALARRSEQVLVHDPELDARRPHSAGRAAPSRLHWMAAAAAATALALLAFGLFARTGNDPSPGRVLLLHNVLSQVRVHAEAGFEDGLEQTGLTGSTLDVQESEAVDAALDREPDLVIVPAVEFDIGATAAARSKAHFVALDQLVEGPNVTSLILNANEGSYLAGVAAALSTRSGTVGFVGGVDEELIWEFAAGFVAGVEATDPDVEVLAEYLAEPPDFGAGYENAPAGEATARRMYTAGADVVFAAAGTSGLGVFEAAADISSETGLFRWAIGVDTDQHRTVLELPLSVDAARWQPHILTSVLKHTDVVVRDALVAFANGELEPGTQLVGLAEGVGGLSYSGGFLDAHREDLQQAHEQIVAGKIDVPCRPDERIGRSSPERAHPCE